MDLEGSDLLSQVAMWWNRGVQAAFRGSTWDRCSTKYRVLLSPRFEKGASFYPQHSGFNRCWRCFCRVLAEYLSEDEGPSLGVRCGLSIRFAGLSKNRTR